MSFNFTDKLAFIASGVVVRSNIDYFGHQLRSPMDMHMNMLVSIPLARAAAKKAANRPPVCTELYDALVAYAVSSH